MKAERKSDVFVQWAKENCIVLIYILFSVIIEMVAVYAIEKNLWISRPYVELGILIFFASLIYMIPKNKLRFFITILLLLVQAVADLGFIIVYEMTGQYFDYGMLSLRDDAMGILESVPMNFMAFYTALFLAITFIIVGLRVIRRFPVVHLDKVHRIWAGVLGVLAIAVCAGVLVDDNHSTESRYETMIYNEQDSVYSSMGIIGNVVNEFAKGLIFTEKETYEDKTIENYLYQTITENSDQFGAAAGHNVVMILAESLEWYPFIISDEFPNQFKLSEEEIEEIYPNLTRLYNESVKVTNFHSREKTDISETFSILGSYPTGAYVDYDYETNTLPQTVPNLLRMLEDENIQTRSFHNGYKSFYNREKTHTIFGFEKLMDSYDMYDLSDELVRNGKEEDTTMHDYLSQGERNLDSEMIYTCKDIMFPTSTRFYTYITTITTHGMYYERDNLSEYREKLLTYCQPETEDQETLFNYMTTVMELDKAIGVMFDELEKRNLLDNTAIVLFGDHNTYYQQLSNTVKGIEGYETDRYYTDLYKVPLMIYDKNLEPETIDKFTCTADIVPTVLDILGIRTYEHMYYGNSVFNDKESVLYSRAYGIFVGDGMVCRSLNNFLYLSDTVTEEYKQNFLKDAETLVEEIRYCDQIFQQDYFADKKHYDTFIQKMREIQQ